MVIFVLICSSVDVEVGDEAGPHVLCLIGTVDADLGVIVTKGSERGDQPGDSIGVLISRAVLSWVV